MKVWGDLKRVPETKRGRVRYRPLKDEAYYPLCSYIFYWGTSSRVPLPFARNILFRFSKLSICVNKNMLVWFWHVPVNCSWRNWLRSVWYRSILNLFCGLHSATYVDLLTFGLTTFLQMDKFYYFIQLICFSVR